MGYRTIGQHLGEKATTVGVMEEIQDGCQSPSDWGSMQDLASWGGGGGGGGGGVRLELHGRTWSMTRRELGLQSERLSLVTHYTVMDSSPPAQASTCPGPSEDHLDDPGEA